MKINVLEKSEMKVKFVLEGASPAFANTLRRVMVNEVPTMSVEFVDFEINTSGLFDEVLAHRIGLVPLTFDRKLYKTKRRSEPVLVLEKEGPCIVKAGDMKSTADDVKPWDPEIPLVELLEGQSVKFEATAQLGVGKKHIKWQAANVGYGNTPSVRVNQEKVENKVVDICPTKVFEKKDGRVRVARENDCILCMRCTEISDGVTIKADENSFIFRVESVCGLPVKEVIDSALEIIETKASDLQEEVKKAVK